MNSDRECRPAYPTTPSHTALPYLSVWLLQLVLYGLLRIAVPRGTLLFGHICELVITAFVSGNKLILLFSERELARPSVCRLPVTFVSPTQVVQIFGNISTALGTLTIH